MNNAPRLAAAVALMQIKSLTAVVSLARDRDGYRFPLAMFVLADPRILRADRLH
jgi:hypothetical protein